MVSPIAQSGTPDVATPTLTGSSRQRPARRFRQPRLALTSSRHRLDDPDLCVVRAGGCTPAFGDVNQAGAPGSISVLRFLSDDGIGVLEPVDLDLVGMGEPQAGSTTIQKLPDPLREILMAGLAPAN